MVQQKNEDLKSRDENNNSVIHRIIIAAIASKQYLIVEILILVKCWTNSIFFSTSKSKNSKTTEIENRTQYTREQPSSKNHLFLKIISDK